MRKFDLNIEQILENWDVAHAIREIIANAIDEHTITGTADILIYKDNGSWFIRDYGRGIHYAHLTQNENQEKLVNPHAIGKFGIGLKDALATFDRQSIIVTIKSKYGIIKTEQAAKGGFSDITTLHATIEEADDQTFVGTEVKLSGVEDDQIESAKRMFLAFSGEEIIDSTRQGQIIRKKEMAGNVYINGVKVAEEANFIFSYNITNITASIKKALNRERSNVGRSAYTDSIKKIILASSHRDVAETLARDLQYCSSGTSHDELGWLDIQEHAVRILNHQGRYLFLTAKEAMSNPDMIGRASSDYTTIITIPDNLRTRIANTKDSQGNPIIDLSHFIQAYNNDFHFEYVHPDQLTPFEAALYNLTPLIIDFFGGIPEPVKNICISSTMRKEIYTHEAATLGCWHSATSSIVISREALKSMPRYCGVLIHELIHAKTGQSDITREFETSLTEYLGRFCAGLISIHEKNANKSHK